MDLIIELIHVLQQYPPQALDDLLPPKSKLRKLYNAVTKDRIHTDDEAAHLVYGAKLDDKDKKKYAMLKRNLLRKLTDLVLVAEPRGKNVPPYLATKLDCERKLAVAEKLLIENVYHNAEGIITQVARTANTLQLSEVQAKAHSLLRHLYTLKGVPAKAADHHQKLLHSLEARRNEEALLGQWDLLLSNAKYGVGRHAGWVQAAQQVLDEHAHARPKTGSTILQWQLLRIQLFRDYHACTSNRLLDAVHRAEDFLMEHPQLTSTAHALELNLFKAYAHRDNRELSQLHKSLQACRAQASYQAYNLFEVQALQYQLLVHEDKPDAVQDLLKEVLATSQYNFLHPLDQAGWFLRQVFTYLWLVHTGREPRKWLRKTTEELTMPAFNQRTKHALPDRTGYGLVAQWLRLLLMHQRGMRGLHDEAEAFTKYILRNVANCTEVRTVAFAKLVAKVVGGKKPETALLRAVASNACEVCEWLPYKHVVRWIRSD